jgi:hypothetical protein
MSRQAKMLDAWYFARGVSRGLMRQKHEAAIEGRCELGESLDRYEDAHDVVTRVGGEFLGQVCTQRVYH